MDAAAEIGWNPVSKHQIQPECGDEQADAGRDDCRTRLANRDREILISPVQLTTSRIDNLIQLIHTTLVIIYLLCSDHIDVLR